MIEIPINAIFAYAMAGLMVVFFMLAFVSFLAKAPNFAAAAILIIFIIDMVLLIVSGVYATTPVNGTKYFSYGWPDMCINKTAIAVIEPCIYPKTNPYEDQPIHPIKWVIGFFWYSAETGSTWVNNNVRFT